MTDTFILLIIFVVSGFASYLIESLLNKKDWGWSREKIVNSLIAGFIVTVALTTYQLRNVYEELPKSVKQYQKNFNKNPATESFIQYLDFDGKYQNDEEFLYKDYYNKIAKNFQIYINNLKNDVIQNEKGTAETLDFWRKIHDPRIIKNSFKATSWLALKETWQKPIVNATLKTEKDLHQKYGIEFTRIFIVKDDKELAQIKSSTAKKQKENLVDVKYVYAHEFDDNYVKEKMLILKTRDFVIIDDIYLLQLFDENNDRFIRTSRLSKNSIELNSAIAVFNHLLGKAKDF